MPVLKRVPVLNGHTAAVFINFEKKPTKEQLIEKLESFKGFPQEAELPSAPKQFIQYLSEDDKSAGNSRMLTTKMEWVYLSDV